MIEPKFVLLDEIDSGVDVDAMQSILSAIDYLKNRGVGVLIITHYDTIIKRISKKSSEWFYMFVTERRIHLSFLSAPVGECECEVY